MPRYEQYLTTLTAYKRKRGITDTDDDTLLVEMIGEASSWFSHRCQRVFVPYRGTRYYDRYSSRLHGHKLDLDEDLLEVLTLTTSGTTLDGDDYALQDINFNPYWQIQLLSSTGATWGTPSEPVNAIVVDGIWGYHTNYAAAWKQKTTLGAAVSDTTTTSVTVGSAAALEVLQYIQIDTEQMLVTAITGNVCTVERGVNGTTAATHLNGAGVKAYQQTPDVRKAVNRIVDFFYDHRDTFNRVIQAADGTETMDDLMPPDVLTSVYNHERQWTEVLG